jgi:hypothetical protein
MAVGYLQMLDSTNAADIREFLKKSLESLSIPLDKIGSVCTDGGRIAVEACKDVFDEANHLVCLNKTLDSVVNKSLLTISALKDFNSKLKAIVEFFKQSNIAAQLKNEQAKKPDTPLTKTLKLIESLPSSWKSILKSVQRFVLLLPEVKTVLATISSSESKTDAPKLDDSFVKSLTSIEQLLTVFETISDRLSESNFAPRSGSSIIDLLFLLHLATIYETTDHITVQFIENLSRELKKGFEDTFSNTVLAAANLLDPRYTMAFFLFRIINKNI